MAPREGVDAEDRARDVDSPAAAVAAAQVVSEQIVAPMSTALASGSRTQALVSRQVPGSFVASEIQSAVVAAEEAVAWLRCAHPEWLPQVASSGISSEAMLLDLFVERLVKRGAPYVRKAMNSCKSYDA